MTAPSVENREQWQGQSHVTSAGLNPTVQPRCVQWPRRPGAARRGRHRRQSFLRPARRRHPRPVRAWRWPPWEVPVLRGCRTADRSGTAAVEHARPRVVPAAQGVGEDQGTGGAVAQAPFAQAGDHMDVRGRQHAAHEGQPVNGDAWTSGRRIRRSPAGRGKMTRAGGTARRSRRSPPPGALRRRRARNRRRRPRSPESSASARRR